MAAPALPPTVVLVHGAWADGSSWSPVITDLRRAGVAVTAAPIPLTSLSEDVGALNRTIDRTSGPVLLAAHAYAGAVIAATDHPRVRGLVFIAALAPDEAETVADVFYRGDSHPQAPQLAPDDAGWIWLPTDAFPTAFAQQASAEQHELLAAVQRPIAVQCIQQPVPRPGWKQLPSWYLIAEQDRMINPDTQRFMAKRMQARIHSHDVDHAPLVSRPQVVTDMIAEALEHVATDSESGGQ
ncbi:MAG TPA: alpha/beta hydrolase [Mycobacterium sp.]|nr:alpha/beta hydrolase [Mycobacterium sp.]